jgi:type I restriction enzyme S subunit
VNWQIAPLANIMQRQVVPPHLSAQAMWRPKPGDIDGKTGSILRKAYETDVDIDHPLVFDKGDVLLSKFRPAASRVTIADEAGIGGNEWIALHPDTRLVDRDYLACYLRSPSFREQASQHAVGAVMPRITKNWLDSHAIPLPPIVEQRHIAAVLGRASRLLQVQRNVNHNINAVLQAQYVKMFGDPTNNPRQLPKVVLGELLEWRVGKAIDASALFHNGSYPVYGAGTKLRYTDDWLCDANTVILTRAGPQCGTVRYTRQKAWVTAHAMYVQNKRKGLDDHYLRAALAMARLGRIDGPVLSIKAVQAAEILLPDLEQQQQFARFANKLAFIEQQQDKAGAHLARLWANLNEQAFSGQLSAKWRSRHMNELHGDMALQAGLLPASSIRRDWI